MDVFDIVILGFDRSRPDSPAAGLQRVFPIDQGTAVRLINALPATVKRGVPQTAAEQYQAALTAIGARVELRKSEPKPEATAPSPSKAPAAAVAPAVLAPSRFTGAATVKQGSPIDSVAPGPMPAASAPPVSTALLATERPPAPMVSHPASASGDAPAVAARTPPVSDGAEKWGGLLAPPKAAAPAATPSTDNLPADEREQNRQELFRRLMNPHPTGASGLTPAEAAGGISVLELDLPPPRAGWSSPDTETIGADDVRAPAVDTPLTTTPLLADRSGGPGSHAGGVRAGGSVRPPPVQVFEPPPDARSFHEALPDAVALSVREGGAQWILLCGGVGLVTTLLMVLLRGHSVLSMLLGFVAALTLCALCSEQAVWTLRAVVDDLDSPDAPDLRGSDMGRYFSAGFHLLGFAVATQLPFLAWLVRHRDTMPGALVSDPIGLLFLVVSAGYWPMAVGLQAMTENPMAVWFVPRGVRAIAASFGEYLTLCLAGATMALLPIGVALLMTRMGLPAELSWLGVGLGMSLSQGTIAALFGHIARLHPKAFDDV